MESLGGFEKIAPHLTHPLVLVGFGLLVIFGFLQAVLRSGKVPKLGPRTGPRVVEQGLRYGLVVALAFLAGGFALAFWESSQRPDVYRIRSTVLAADGAVVDDAELVSSVGGDFRPGDGIAELVLPVSLRPADGRITVRARRGAEKGAVEIALKEDFQPAETLQLVKEEVTVRGLVVDAEDDRALSGVRVSVVGHPGEAAETGDDGAFAVPAHVGDAAWVRLRAEKEGYDVWDELVMAGGPAIKLELEETR